MGISGGIPLGDLTIYLKLTSDFIDVEDNSLIWQAVVESKFDPEASPEKREERFEKIVQKALST